MWKRVEREEFPTLRDEMEYESASRLLPWYRGHGDGSRRVGGGVSALTDTELCIVLFQDYKPEEDPALFHSAKTDRGPLGPEWKVPVAASMPSSSAL